MGRISEETIARVQAASDIVEVIGTSYVQLKRAGTSWRGLCPFHNEKTPSFYVHPAKQSFHCFGCGAGGTVFRFLMEYEKIDFPTAVRKLAQRAGIVVVDETPEEKGQRGVRQRLLALHREVAEFYHATLMRRREVGARAREYLASRGLDKEAAVRWQLGYAPDQWDTLQSWGREKGYDLEEMRLAGLVGRSERGDYYDRFRNRLMFPIHNDVGEVIAFSGRTLGNDPAKYVNSPETPVFTKGRVLFGLDKTKRAVIEASEAIVCEGQIDLITAFEAGVHNVIAPQGTAFTPHQARLVRQLAESVVLCFDSDGAGQKAVDRSLPALLAKGLTVRVARMPVGEDPDSLIRGQGIESFRALIKSAADFFDDALERGLTPETTPRQRADLARRLAGYVAGIDDVPLREAVGNKVRAQLGISSEAFAAAMKTASPHPGEYEEVLPHQIPELSEAALILCRLAIASTEAREWLRNKGESAAQKFGSEFALVDRIIKVEGSLLEAAGMVAFCANLDPDEEKLVTGLALEHLPSDPVRAAEDTWNGLEAARLREQVVSLQAGMRVPGRSLDEIAAAHKQILDLQKRLSEIRQPFLT